MLSALATQFSQARTTANFNALANAEPLTAAKYLARASAAGGLDAPWKTQLEQLLSTTFEPGARDTALKTFFAQNQAAISAMELAAVQAARVDTLGFTTREPEPVHLTGTIGVAADGLAPTLTTPEGTFRLEMPNWKVGYGNQALYFEVNALQSFNGQVGSVRAYPTDQPGVLAVEEFSPSSSPHFTSGRLSLENGKLGINVRPGKWVEVRDPAIAAALSPLAKARNPNDGWAGTGVILPGTTAKQDAQGWYLEGPVTDYWMLARSNGAGAMLAGHGQSYVVAGGTTPWPENTATRLLVLGHSNADRSISVKAFRPTPQVRVETGVEPRRDGAALIKLTPVDVEVPAGVPDTFGV